MVLAILSVMSLEAKPIELSVEVEGVKRTALVVLPTKEAKEGSPLIFCFHGHSGTARNAYNAYPLYQYWPEATVVYPQGLPTRTPRDKEGKGNGWQANNGIKPNKDLQMFEAMLAKIKKDYKIDEHRLYIMGHSNGGAFTYYLWIHSGVEFAAIGPSASAGAGFLKLGPPTSVFHQAGKNDTVVAFTSQERQIERVRKGLGFDEKPAKVDGKLTIYNGPNGIELATYIHNGVHTYARDANEHLVEFFKKHRKP